MIFKNTVAILKSRPLNFIAAFCYLETCVFRNSSLTYCRFRDAVVASRMPSPGCTHSAQVSRQTRPPNDFVGVTKIPKELSLKTGKLSQGTYPNHTSLLRGRILAGWLQKSLKSGDRVSARKGFHADLFSTAAQQQCRG